MQGVWIFCFSFIIAIINLVSDKGHSYFAPVSPFSLLLVLHAVWSETEIKLEYCAAENWLATWKSLHGLLTIS